MPNTPRNRNRYDPMPQSIPSAYGGEAMAYKVFLLWIALVAVAGAALMSL